MLPMKRGRMRRCVGATLMSEMRRCLRAMRKTRMPLSCDKILHDLHGITRNKQFGTRLFQDECVLLHKCFVQVK